VLNKADFPDESVSLHYAPKQPKTVVRETEEVVAFARRFCEEVARPVALEYDRETHQDPGWLPWEVVKRCNEWGLYTAWVPKIFGGKGWSMPSLSYFLEEVGSVCLSIANVIGVHYLGVAGLMMAGRAPVIARVMREVRAGEASGDPCIIALAITEPTAGTDVEEVDLLSRGKVSCQARKVDGGYVINGTKIFISNGHVSKWTVVFAYADLKRPADSMVTLMVRHDAAGFSCGRHENKMGQRACPASVLAFDDCFVPDDQVIFSPERVAEFSRQAARDITMRYVDYIVSITRPAVGAFGCAAARGAYEAALAFSSRTSLGGRPMINHEWVQCRLAEMYANARMARFAYVEANVANAHRGVYKLLQAKPVYYALRWTPRWLIDTLIAPLVATALGTWFLSKWYLDWQKPEDQHLCTGLGSLAKFTCTDLGLRNSQMALELMGQAGLRQDAGVEKILRDVKLLQIYEGTNQLNRLNVFKSFIAPVSPKARAFAD
jgi:acyl-CoA dehydrogenase